MLKPFLGRSLIAVAAAALAAGCSGYSTPQGSAALPLVASPASVPLGWPTAKKKPKQILFVADLQGSVVRLYDPNTPNPSPEGMITDGVASPTGLAVDSKGSLYVSNVGNSANGTITVYSAGKSSPRLTIPCPGYYGIAVDSKGDIFATSVGGTVTGYKPGKKAPFETIGGFDNPVGIAADSKNNIWVSDDTANKVYTITAGTKTVKDANLMGLGGPIGLAIGNNDVLYVTNDLTDNVSIYPAGSKKPSSKITDGIGAYATLSGLTSSETFFQSNQTDNVVGYKKGQKTPFSTIVGNADPLGIASSPQVTK